MEPFVVMLVSQKATEDEGEDSMPMIIMNAKLDKPYDDWVRTFDQHQSLRTAVGIKDIYRGHELSDSNTIHVVMSVPSMEIMDAFMKEHAEFIENAGHNLESTQVTVCID